ncbi:hypothetical protein D187_003646 [Cystobacter fuscus DSM 2262]|uniref:Uncharacterized protein n=1 Tax=Cystobacter fuscus (strain ATCC 25194 / DSM 2262 / NBRC 100088 / M29) TaxID=1242864 RepID=S9P6X6_CYSF2|nr:hypothetical protein D187_003646 [Cystobacter fuscus DSM 2262]
MLAAAHHTPAPGSSSSASLVPSAQGNDPVVNRLLNPGD